MNWNCYVLNWIEMSLNISCWYVEINLLTCLKKFVDMVKEICWHIEMKVVWSGRPSGFYWYIFFNIVTIWLWNIFISWINGTFMLDMYVLKCFKFELHLKIYIFTCLFRHIISVRFSVDTSVFHGNWHLKTAFYLPISTIFPL